MNNCLIKNRQNDNKKQQTVKQTIYIEKSRAPKCEFCDTILVSNLCPNGHKKQNGLWIRCGINGCHIPTTNSICPCMTGDEDLYDIRPYIQTLPTIVEEEK
jgi:hypothetical protein